MTVPADITLGEVVRGMADLGRRVDEAVRKIEETSRAAAERETRFEQRFLPRAEYDLSQQSDAIQMRGLETEVHKISKQQEACEKSRRDDLAEIEKRRREDAEAADARWAEASNQQRANRTLVLSALVFPVLVALITAALLSQGGVG